MSMKALPYLEVAAKALYTKSAPTGPEWNQLGEVTKGVWYERVANDTPAKRKCTCAYAYTMSCNCPPDNDDDLVETPLMLDHAEWERLCSQHTWTEIRQAELMLEWLLWTGFMPDFLRFATARAREDAERAIEEKRATRRPKIQPPTQGENV